MCTVSVVLESYKGIYDLKWAPIFDVRPVTREEFEKLKIEIMELRKLIEAAKEFDVKTGQPDCEMQEKVELIRKIAKIVGVELSI